jgi:hypothetical protein
MAPNPTVTEGTTATRLVAKRTSTARLTDGREVQPCECKRHDACHRKRRPKRRFCSTCIDYCGAR